jgi:hypothetical protein
MGGRAARASMTFDVLARCIDSHSGQEDSKDIATYLGVSRATLYRYLAEVNAA